MKRYYPKHMIFSIPAEIDSLLISMLYKAHSFTIEIMLADLLDILRKPCDISLKKQAFFNEILGLVDSSALEINKLNLVLETNALLDQMMYSIYIESLVHNCSPYNSIKYKGPDTLVLSIIDEEDTIYE